MTKHYRHKGDAIKALSDYRVGGYLVRFTDETDPDLYGEHFNKSTDFWLERGYPVVGSRVLLEHGLDSFAKVMPIGLIEMLKEDDIGLYIEAKLNDRAEYERMLQDMKNRKAIDFTDEEISQKAMLAEKTIRAIVETGKVGWSSGALPQSVEVNEETKHIKSWAIIEGSLTFTPAEPDGTEIAPIKSALEDLSTFLTLSIPAQPAREAQPIEQHAEKNSSITISSTSADVTVSNITWLPSQIKSTIKGLPMEFLQKLLAMIQEYMAAQGGDDAMASAVVEEVKAETEEEELVKAMEDEEIAEKVAEKALQIADARLAKRQKSNSAVDRVLDARIKKLERSAEPVDPYGAGGSHNGNPRKQASPQISVSELRAYTALSAGEMALGVKLAMSRVAEHDRKMWKLADLVERDILSEAYVKTMAHKSAQRIKSWQLSEDSDEPEQNDYATMKAYGFLKADELHATDITNQGAEWVEMMYDTDLWRRVRNETELFNLMESKGMRVKDIPTGVKGMNVKLEDGSGTVYTLQEGHSVAANGYPEAVANLSQLTTNEVEESLATHIIAQGFTFQLQERSIIDVVGYLNEDMQTTLTESLEDAFINGDKTTGASANINRIDGTVPVGMQAPLYLAWDGIRHNYIVDNTGNGSDNNGTALAATDYEKVRAQWPLRIRRRKNNILFLIDEGIETQTRRLAEHFTVGVAGESNATFFTGDLNVLVGFDVYASGYMGLTNGDGKISVTAGNNVKGQIAGIFAPYWQYGRQLNIKIEEARFPLSQASVFVATVNHLLKARSSYAAVGKYDIAVA
jgi:hypothetical protein